MGTHPIFESDFDCLTDVRNLHMSSELGIRRPGPSVSRGVYGFVMFLAAKGISLLYIIWVLTPQSFLDRHGLDDFFPSKYWALAFPAWLIVATVSIWVVYAAINAKLAAKHNFWQNLDETDQVFNVVF